MSLFNRSYTSEITTMQKNAAQNALKMPNQNNPIVAHKFSADPAVLVYNDTVYVYATNDMQELEISKGAKSNSYQSINTFNVFYSKDLVNWTDAGEIPVAGKKNKNGAAKWATNSWAPAIACKKINGKDKFFLYFADSANGIGVLSADSPLGPFKDPINKALISRNTPTCNTINWLFDPAVFVDDDNRAYIYFGGGHYPEVYKNPKTARCVELGDDMVSIKGTPQVIDAPYLFEDSGINKIGKKYYYTYCSNWTERTAEDKANGLPIAVIAYMTSDSPLGPYKAQGYTLENPGTYFGPWGNNHHWIFEFKGKYYIAYHAQTTEKLCGFAEGGYRSIFISDFTINKDGSFPIQKATMEGVSQVQNFNPYQKIPAATFCSAINVAVSSNQTIKPVSDGGYICIKNVDFSDGASSISITIVPDKKTSGKIQLRLDNFGGSGKDICTIETGNSAEIKKEIKFDKNLKGIHNLYFILSRNIELKDWEIFN